MAPIVWPPSSDGTLSWTVGTATCPQSDFRLGQLGGSWVAQLVVCLVGDVACDADLVDQDVVALVRYNDCCAGANRQRFVAGEVEEAARVCSNRLVLIESKSDNFRALGVGAFTDKG